jgi:hypothetical protein
MHWFGKFVLLPLNLIAAGAFVYLATQDWKGRQTIEAAGLRHLLLVNGLPLGTEKDAPAALPTEADAEIPFAAPMAGGFVTTTVSKKLLETYFQAAPGGEFLGGANTAVPNQLAEARRVKARIDDAVSRAEGTDKIKILAAVLRFQPETFEQRVALNKLIAEENVEGLQKELADRFAAVLDAPKPVDPGVKDPAEEGAAADALRDKVAAVDASRSPSLDETERRLKLAHLLVHLNPDADWQKRVMVVVGLRRYVDAIAAQTKRFEDMATRVRLQILEDQGGTYEYTDPGTGAKGQYFTGFLGQLNALERLARQWTEASDRQAKLRAAWIEQKTKEDNAVAQRQTQLTAIENQLRKIKAEVDELLVRQGEIEASMFAVQREVAITLDEVYKLQAELAARERDLLGLPPLPKE